MAESEAGINGNQSQVCPEVYRESILLPCGHSFCKGCLEEISLVLANGDERQSTCPVHGDLSKLPCPTCRRDVSIGDLTGCLGKTGLLDNITRKYKSVKATKRKEELIIWCGICVEDPPRKAVKQCSFCKLAYCESCMSKYGLGELAHLSSSSEPDIVTCPNHNGEIKKIFCKSCHIPICYICDRFGKHEGHDIAELKYIFSQEQDSLNHEVMQLTERNSVLQRFTDDLYQLIDDIKINSTKTETTIKIEFRKLSEELARAEKRAQMETTFNTRATILLITEQLNRCKQIMNDNLENVDLIEQVLALEELEPFLLSVAALRNRLTAGDSAYINCPKTPIKSMEPRPVSVNTKPLISQLKALRLGNIAEIREIRFNWNHDNAHPQLMIDEKQEVIQLSSSIPLNLSDRNSTVGVFQGSSFSTLGSNALNISPSSWVESSIWKINVLKSEKGEELAINYSVGLMTGAYRDRPIDADHADRFLSRCMVQGKQGDSYQYKFVSDGKVVQIMDSKEEIMHIIVLVDLSRKGSITFVDGNSLKQLQVFTGCDFSTKTWYPALAIDNVKYKLVV